MGFVPCPLPLTPSHEGQFAERTDAVPDIGSVDRSDVRAGIGWILGVIALLMTASAALGFIDLVTHNYIGGEVAIVQAIPGGSIVLATTATGEAANSAPEEASVISSHCRPSPERQTTSRLSISGVLMPVAMIPTANTSSAASGAWSRPMQRAK